MSLASVKKNTSSNHHFDKLLHKAKEYHRGGNAKMAQKNYEKLLKIEPKNPKVLSLLGGLFIETDEFEKASKMLARAYDADPESADINYNFALSFFHLKDYDSAIKYFHKAVEINKKHDSAWYMLGKTLIDTEEEKHLESALYCFVQDIEITERLDAFFLASELCVKLKRWEDGREISKRCLRKDPTSEMALYCLAKALIAEHYGANRVDPVLIEPALKIANVIKKHHPDSWRGDHVIAEACSMVSEDEIAIDHYKKVIAKRPDLAIMHSNLGIILLKSGRFAEGWKEVCYRKNWGAKLFGIEQDIFESLEKPMWEGQLEKGLHLFVACEQGIGDQILHAQMALELAQKGLKISMTVNKKIIDLMKRSMPEVDFYKQRVPLPDGLAETIDYKIDLLGLGQYLRTSMSAFDKKYYFLKPDPELVKEFKEKYQQFGNKLKVGISWMSKSKSAGRVKSTKLLDWAPLLKVPGIQFINVQYGDVEADIKSVSDELGVEVFTDDFDPYKDIDKATAQIAALDLVISVSNATVHMSGQMNIPTWTLLASRPLWHWFFEGDKTVWYDSLKLYRQRQLEDWKPLLAQVGSDLQAYVESRR